jgi:ubiquinone/menaquinone biosynthesis C-methylase UbiE
MFLQFFRTLRQQRRLDPLHVTMTGVRMGEHIIQIGCDDTALLGGLARKVGLSGNCTVAVFDDESAARARKVAANEGVLIDVKVVTPGVLDVEPAGVDMVVVDDTRGTFARLREADRVATLAEARRVVREGGRIEIVERVALTGILGGAITRPEGYRIESELATAGFKAVRLLAEEQGVRFVEGLKG